MARKFPQASMRGLESVSVKLPSDILPEAGNCSMAWVIVGANPWSKTQTTRKAAAKATTACTAKRDDKRDRANAATPRGVNGSQTHCISATLPMKLIWFHQTAPFVPAPVKVLLNEVWLGGILRDRP